MKIIEDLSQSFINPIFSILWNYTDDDLLVISSVSKKEMET